VTSTIFTLASSSRAGCRAFLRLHRALLHRTRRQPCLQSTLLRGRSAISMLDPAGDRGTFPLMSMTKAYGIDFDV
jgi:hypothetical protein